MNTVITHFYNEEYLLPWWINHHKKLFDYGIMINHNSTDRSVEICKQMCPHNWKIVDTTLTEFKTEYLDCEVKFYESTVTGFKTVLTLTEFFMPPMSLDDLNSRMIKEDKKYMRTIGVCMVDMFPDNLPTYDKPLFSQKHHGMISGYKHPLHRYDEDAFKTMYGRHYHNDRFGKYGPGRHWVWDEVDHAIFPEDVFILKYKYSPWNDTSINRIMQFAPKITMEDLEKGWCTPHMLVKEEHWSLYNYLRNTMYDLRDDPVFLNTYNYCMTL